MSITINDLTIDHHRIQRRTRDLAMGTWSPWAECPNEAEGTSALTILSQQGELFGKLTLTDATGEKCEEYRLDPMVKARVMEHSEERSVRVGDLQPPA